jgi:hypothetical protein
MVPSEMLKRARSEMSHIFGRKGFFGKDCEEQDLWEEKGVYKKNEKSKIIQRKGCLRIG